MFVPHSDPPAPLRICSQLFVIMFFRLRAPEMTEEVGPSQMHTCLFSGGGGGSPSSDWQEIDFGPQIPQG